MRYLLTIFFVFIAQIVTAQSNNQSRSISYIETTSTWVYIYDESGKRFYTDAISRFGEVIGYSSSFFIVKRGSFYVLYDVNIRPLNTMTISNVGEILSVTGDTFTAKKYSFITTYDKTGKRLYTKTQSR